MQVPSAHEIRRGKGACGVNPMDFIKVEVPEADGVETNFGFENLEPEQKYEVYVALQDDGSSSKPPNLQPKVS